MAIPNASTTRIGHMNAPPAWKNLTTSMSYPFNQIIGKFVRSLSVKTHTAIYFLKISITTPGLKIILDPAHRSIDTGNLLRAVASQFIIINYLYYFNKL
jgi:hypothetical protein